MADPHPCPFIRISHPIQTYSNANPKYGTWEIWYLRSGSRNHVQYFERRIIDWSIWGAPRVTAWVWMSSHTERHKKNFALLWICLRGSSEHELCIYYIWTLIKIGSWNCMVKWSHSQPSPQSVTLFSFHTIQTTQSWDTHIFVYFQTSI